MRRKLVLGVGLAALVGGSAAAQFAVDRVSPAPTPPTSPAAPPAKPTSGPPAPVGPVVGGFQPLTPPVSPVSPIRPTSPAPDYKPLYSSPAPSVGGYVPPSDGLRPASYATPGAPAPAPAANFALPAEVEITTALPKDHPWLIKPEHGPWFILVKSYVRPAKGSKAEKDDPGLSARELAEGLATEIRDTFRVQAFLYEYISEERKAEARAIAVARQKARTEYIAQVEALKQKAQLQGMDFLQPDKTLHVRRHDTRDNIGVLVGGFQSETDALKALAKLKTWPAPKNEMLMDGGAIVQKGADGKQEIVKTRLNPYTSAFVVQNPCVSRAAQPTAARPALDPFIVKLNEDNPYSLLKATKAWTLGVKSFTAPVEIMNRNADTSLMKKFGFGKSGNALVAGGEQAEAMAKALRAMKGPGGQSLNLEAFVLHTRYASIVTVGQFDSPDDPALHAMKRLLTGMTVNVTEDQAGTRRAANAPSLFDNCLPVPVPKP